MTDDTDALPLDEDRDSVTKSNWLGSRKRTKQYYALRTSTVWTFFDDKTREPNDAKRAVWGAELSVIDMMALEPQPIKRGWYRFTTAREIVDLGRNRKDAMAHYAFLKREASLYTACLKQSSQEHIDKIRSLYSKAERAETWARFGARLASTRSQSAFALISEDSTSLGRINWGLELCREVVPLVDMQLEDPGGVTLDKILAIAHDLLIGKQQTFQAVKGSWNLTTAMVAMAVIKQNSFVPALEILSKQRAAIKEVAEARKNMTSHMYVPAYEREHAPVVKLDE